MVSIRYPSSPGGVDAGSIIDMFNGGFDRAKGLKDERDGISAFGGYLDSIYGAQGRPQTLSDLASVVSPSQGQNTVQRAPLPAVADPATARVEQAFAAQGQGRADLNGNAIAGRFLKTVRDGGLSNPYALAAIAATGKHESGFSPKNAFRTWSDPSQSGEAGTAGGIMSWRGPRLQAMQQFAQQNGDDPRAPSPETQAKFLLAEDPSLIQKLQSAQSAEEAQQIMNNAWRFAGFDQPGGEAGARVASAQAFLPQFGGTPSQGGGQSAPVQVVDASGQTGFSAPDPSSILPPRDVMLGLFKSPQTRPFAIQLAQAAQGLRADANDPLARVKYEAAVAQLQKLQQGDVPTGYRQSADGGLEAIPGGPADPDNPLNVKKTTPSNGITIGPDGTVQIGGGKLTEGQSKDVGYYTRGLDADAQLANLDTQLTDWGQQNADKIPLGLGNYLREPSFKQAKVAADSFLTAILRKDTGAAITKQEFEIYGPMFLPVPGDDQGTIEQKRRARQVALLAIRSGLGTAEAVAKANEVTLGLPAASPNNVKGGRVGEIARPTSDAEYNALPSGSVFIDPDDNKQYRKP